MNAGQQSSHWKVHHLVLPYTSKLCRLAVEGIATEGDRNHPLARVYPFFWPDCLPRSSMFYSLYLSIPTAVQINEDSLSLPDWFLRTPWPFCCGMKQQEGNSTNKSRAWWSQHKHSGNHPSLPRINKRKATSDPGTFWHAGSGGAAVPRSLSIISKRLATVVSTLPFPVALSRRCSVRKPRTVLNFLHHFYIAGCPGLLSLLAFQCIYSRAANCARTSGITVYLSVVARSSELAQYLLQILGGVQRQLGKTGLSSTFSLTLTEF